MKDSFQKFSFLIIFEMADTNPFAEDPFMHEDCYIGEGISLSAAEKICQIFEINGDYAEEIRLYTPQDPRVANVTTPGHGFTVLAQDIVYRENGQLITETVGTFIGEEDEGIEKKYRILFGWDEYGPYEQDANGVIDLIGDDSEDDEEEDILEFLFAGDLKNFHTVRPQTQL